MPVHKKSVLDISIKKMDRELFARGDQCTRAPQFIPFCGLNGGHIGIEDNRPVEGRKP